MVTVSKVTEQVVTVSKVSEQVVTESEVTEQVVTDSKVTEQVVTENKVTEQVVTDSKVTEQVATGSEVTEQVVTDSEVIEQVRHFTILAATRHKKIIVTRHIKNISIFIEQIDRNNNRNTINNDCLKCVRQGYPTIGPPGCTKRPAAIFVKMCKCIL